MNEEELRKLQKDIEKLEKEQTTEDIIAYIQKIRGTEIWEEDVWNQLLIPACTSADADLFHWLVDQGASLRTMAREVPKYIIWSQENRMDYQKKRIRFVLAYMLQPDGEIVPGFLNEALKQACRYNNIYIVEYLLAFGADVLYVDADGKTPYDYARMFGEQFNDYTLYHYLQPLFKKNGKKRKILWNKAKVLDSDRFFTGTDPMGGLVYEKEEYAEIADRRKEKNK